MRPPLTETLAMLEVELLAQAVSRAYGIDTDGLPRQRLASAACALARRSGAPSVAALIDRVLHDPVFGRLAAGALAACAVTGPSEVAAFEDTVARLVVPWLRTFTYSAIWIADCGDGATVFRLAMLLHEAGLYERTRIHATDPDRIRLAHARRGVVPAGVIDGREGAVRRTGGATRYFEVHGDTATMNPALLRNIVWSHYDLVQGFSFNEFNLIVCRGVLERMPAPARQHVLQLFRDSLPLWGLLALGRDEQPEPSPAPHCFRQWGEGADFYQRTC